MVALNPASPELVITREFDAPRALVWKAWFDPKHCVHWMGPRGCTVTDISKDVRPGGKFRVCMRRDENGEILWHGGVYREVDEPERIVFTFAWEDDDGKPENEMLITLTFAEEKGKTKLTLHQTGFRDAEQRDGHNGGWNSSFDRFVEYLANLKA